MKITKILRLLISVGFFINVLNGLFFFDNIVIFKLFGKFETTKFIFVSVNLALFFIMIHPYINFNRKKGSHHNK
jgi:thiosulfate reductase cytochrome b subunit